MKALQTLFIILISQALHSQNEPFQIFLYQDTLVVNQFDTAFSYSSDKGNFHYKNGSLRINRNDGQTTTYFITKIIGFRKDSIYKLPIAEMVKHGRQITVDNNNKKVILEGAFVNGKQVGVWYDRTDKFDFITVYDSTGKELPLIRYIIDTSDQLIHIHEIDTSTFIYSLTEQIDLIINPNNYFKSHSQHMDLEDTIRFCILNLHMNRLGYESWINADYDFIRFVWFRAENPINLNIAKYDSSILYSLLVTDAKYDFDFGNIIQTDSINTTETKEFIKVEKELDRINFWVQISKDDCYGDYFFIEAKIKDKYNLKRINCLEYRLSENKIIMKLFEKISKQVGLKREYRIEY